MSEQVVETTVETVPVLVPKAMVSKTTIFVALRTTVAVTLGAVIYKKMKSKKSVVTETEESTES